VAHIGFQHEGMPYVIPTLYHYSAEEPDRIYLHGGLSSRMLKELATGISVCVTVTELDGLVYSRDAKYHSANYRCVMCFGRGRILEDEDVSGHDVALLPRSHRRPRLHPCAIRPPEGNSRRRGHH